MSDGEWAVQTSRKSRRKNKQKKAAAAEPATEEPVVAATTETVESVANAAPVFVEPVHQPSEVQQEFTQVRSKKKNKRRNKKPASATVTTAEDDDEALPKLEPVVDQPPMHVAPETPISTVSDDSEGEPGWVEVKTKKKRNNNSNNDNNSRMELSKSSTQSSSSSVSVAPTNAFSALQILSPAKSPAKKSRVVTAESLTPAAPVKIGLSESELVHQICSLVSSNSGSSSSQLLNFLQNKVGHTWKKTYQKEFGKFQNFLDSRSEFTVQGDKVFLTSTLAKQKKKQRRKNKKKAVADVEPLPELEPVPKTEPVVAQTKKAATKSVSNKSSKKSQPKKAPKEQERVATVDNEPQGSSLLVPLLFAVLAIVATALFLRNGNLIQ